MSPFKIRLALFFLPTLLITHATAQQKNNTLRGKLIGEVSRPLAFATITMMSADSVQILKLSSDSAGYFQITHQIKDSFSLVFSYTGYKEHTIYVAPTIEDLGSIQMFIAENAMDAVVVRGDQRLLEVEGGNITYNVSKSIDAQGTNAFDALRKAPGVFITSDNVISLNGKAGVLVLIDGRQTFLSGQELADLLKSMPASGIRSFEIIADPTAKYDAAGSAGIINIKTNKTRISGLNGSLTTGISYGISLKQNQDISFNYRNGRYNIYGSYNHFIGNYNYVYGSDREQSGNFYNTYTDDTDKRKRMGTRFGFDYDLDKRNTVGLLVTGNFVLGGGLTVTNTDIGQVGNTAPEEKLFAINDYYFQQTNRYNVNANYQYEHGGRKFSIDADYGTFIKGNSNLQSNRYTNNRDELLSENLYRPHNNIDIDLLAVKSDYTIPLFEGVLESGAKFSKVSSGNDARFNHVLSDGDSLDNRRSNLFRFQEEITAGYLSYKKPIGKLNIQGGLRAEHTSSNATLQFKVSAGDSLHKVKRNYLSIFPSLSISFSPKENHILSLAYIKRIERPAYQDLNPFVYMLDELSFWQGNPFLRPQLTHRLSLQYVYKTATIVTLSYSHTTDYSARITDTTEVSKITMIPKNIGTQRNLSLAATQNVTVSKWWQMTFNGVFYRLQNDIAFDAWRALNLHQLAVRLSAQQRFRLPWELSAELSFYLNSRRLTGGNEISRGVNWIDIAVQKAFWKNKATLRIAFNDIYKGSGFRSSQAFNGFYMKSFGYYETRQIRINFTCKFADKVLKAPRSRNSALENENDRIK